MAEVAGRVLQRAQPLERWCWSSSPPLRPRPRPAAGRRPALPISASGVSGRSSRSRGDLGLQRSRRGVQLRACRAAIRWRAASRCSRGRHRRPAARPARPGRILRVADHADFDRIVLADLPRVLVEVHQPDVLGDRPRRLVVDVLPQQVHADDEQHVELVPAARGPRATRAAGPGRRADDRLGNASRPCVVPLSVMTGAPSRSATATSSSTASGLGHAAAGQDAGVLGRGQQLGGLRGCASSGGRTRRSSGLAGEQVELAPLPSARRAAATGTPARSAASGRSARRGGRRWAGPPRARPRRPTWSRAGPRRPCRPHRIGSSNVSRRSCWPAVTSSGVPSR